MILKEIYPKIQKNILSTVNLNNNFLTPRPPAIFRPIRPSTITARTLGQIFAGFGGYSPSPFPPSRVHPFRKLKKAFKISFPRH